MSEYEQVYGPLGLKDLCVRVHTACGKLGPSVANDDVYTRLPEMALRPADAHGQFVRGCVERVELDQLLDRIVATSVAHHPQGTALLMPGERITRDSVGILQYLLRVRQFNADCPGLEVGINGVDVESDGSGRRHVVTCVKR
jgi:arginine decarboxylase